MVDVSSDSVDPDAVHQATNALQLLRERHEERVVAALRSYGPLSRADLSRHTGLSRATLSTIVRDLIRRRALVEAQHRTRSGSSSEQRRGRPVTHLTLNPATGLAIGVDLGHRRVHVAVANVAHEVVSSASRSCPEHASWSRRMAIATDLIDQLGRQAKLALGNLAGLGVGLVGPVSEAAGRPQRTRDRVEKIRAGLTERFGVPVHVDNNTRLAALAEAIWGAGAGDDNVLYVRLSYGVGGGLIIGGHLYPGATGAAGEFGHVCVDPAGPRCHCGGRGCLEHYVSVRAILRQCRARRLDDVLARLDSGDLGVADALRTAGTRIGTVLAAACNVVNPHVVVIGGELAAAGEVLLESIRQAVQARTHRQAHGDLTIRVGRLGEESAALGGIALTLRKSTLLAGYPAP